LSSNDKEKDLELRIYNFSKNGKHDQIGSVIFRLSQFQTGKKFEILDKLHNASGTLIMEHFLSRTQYQFGDFLQKGLQLALVTCIDFTASNGIPSESNSLHYIGKGKSQYEKAL